VLKAKAQDRQGNPVFIFGLSDENIARLRQGKPILIDMKEMGSVGKVLIYSGATEEQMEAEMKKYLVVPESAKTNA
jgi:hypothetical protein